MWSTYPALKPVTVGETGSGDGRAATLFGFSPKTDALYFFSRAPDSGEGYWLVLPIDENTVNSELSFPIVGDDGSFEEADITIHKILK